MTASGTTFQLTHLLRGATFCHLPREFLPDFNSRTSCEVRLGTWNGTPFRQTFQLTHLLRGATCAGGASILAMQFQLTHLLRGATPTTPASLSGTGFQLTHLLRGATAGPGCACRWGYFNSRTSCEVRRKVTKWHILPQKFQLTHLLRGATPT